jgi:PGAP1-like protein
MTQPLLQAADLRGAARVTSESLAGLASLVQAMQPGIARKPRVRSAVEAVVAAPDAHLPPHPEREAVLAALNGVLGDYLAATGSPWAIRMTFRRSGRPTLLERFAMRSSLPGATARLLVMLHGLCMNDLQWQRAGHDHGESLARELGYTPVYLHYNTGLSVSTNGRILAQLMERLYDAWPVPIQRLSMLGHGMGGLVARSAIHHGALIQRDALRWPARVDDLICLGTPHQGAPLERAGRGIDRLLGAVPYAAAVAGLGNLRSAGINDLRLGNIVSAPATDHGTHRCAQVGLPDGTRCYAIAASVGAAADSPKARLLGDGLVPVDSALGHDCEPDRRLDFAPDRQAVVFKTDHLDLLSSAEVHGLLRGWLG